MNKNILLTLMQFAAGVVVVMMFMNFKLIKGIDDDVILWGGGAVAFVSALFSYPTSFRAFWTKLIFPAVVLIFPPVYDLFVCDYSECWGMLIAIMAVIPVAIYVVLLFVGVLVARKLSKQSCR